jgi:hypothetical protein
MVRLYEWCKENGVPAGSVLHYAKMAKVKVMKRGMEWVSKRDMAVVEAGDELKILEAFKKRRVRK